MNIAYVHTGLFPSNSPSFTFTTCNAIGCAEIFDHVYFFVKKNSTKSSDEVLRVNLNVNQPKNLSICTKKNPLNLNTNYFYYKKVYKALQTLINSQKIDIIISRNPTFLPYLAKFNKKYNVPTFFESHDFFAKLSLRNDINPRKKIRYEKLEQKFIPKISGLICLQQSQKQLYQNLFPETKIYVARTGIHKINTSSSTNRKFVTYIGSLETHKGVETLIRAAGNSLTKPELVIIGGKNEQERLKLQKIIDQYYINSKVFITGWIDKQQLAEYLQKTVIGIIPLQDTFFNRYITSPLKLFDFYSYGIPVIASDLPTTRELIIEHETGLFFKPGDYVDLSQKIDFLKSKGQKLSEMSINIYSVAENYLWKNRALRLKEIFEKHIK